MASPRCDVCNHRTGNPEEYKNRLVCDGCYCEYRAVFDGKRSGRKDRSVAQEEKKKEVPKEIINYFNEIIFKEKEDVL